jgi:hypothetical protein
MIADAKAETATDCGNRANTDLKDIVKRQQRHGAVGARSGHPRHQRGGDDAGNALRCRHRKLVRNRNWVRPAPGFSQGNHFLRAGFPRKEAIFTTLGF